jgi:hypothetical protein
MKSSDLSQGSTAKKVPDSAELQQLDSAPWRSPHKQDLSKVSMLSADLCASDHSSSNSPEPEVRDSKQEGIGVLERNAREAEELIRHLEQLEKKREEQSQATRTQLEALELQQAEKLRAMASSHDVSSIYSAAKEKELDPETKFLIENTQSPVASRLGQMMAVSSVQYERGSSSLMQSTHVIEEDARRELTSMVIQSLQAPMEWAAQQLADDVLKQDLEREKRDEELFASELAVKNELTELSQKQLLGESKAWGSQVHAKIEQASEILGIAQQMDKSAQEEFVRTQKEQVEQYDKKVSSMAAAEAAVRKMRFLPADSKLIAALTEGAAEGRTLTISELSRMFNDLGLSLNDNELHGLACRCIGDENVSTVHPDTTLSCTRLCAFLR